MPWAPLETCVAQHVMPLTPPAEPPPSRTWFHAECTRGYCNGGGRGRPNGPAAHPHGAFVFHDLPGRWRGESVGEVLRPGTPARA